MQLKNLKNIAVVPGLNENSFIFAARPDPALSVHLLVVYSMDQGRLEFESQ